LNDALDALEQEYLELDAEALLMAQNAYDIWGLVDSEYLWKDRCYFTFFSVSLFCYNDDELKDQFYDKYADASYNMELTD